MKNLASYTMYVDDSGSPSLTDNSKYYLLSGVIVNNDHIKKIQKSIFEFKYDNFKESYIEAEIHTHDLFRNKNEFVDLSNSVEKYKLLEKLYKIIGNLPLTIISSGVDKIKMYEQHPDWKVFKIAWRFLAYRFNQYLDVFCQSDKGVMKIDKSTNKEIAELNDIIKDLRRENKKYKRIDNIVCQPCYAHSGASDGIQIADAVAYCTAKRLNGNRKFPAPYWNLIKDKFYSKDDKILGYGLNIFPVIEKIPSEDIQP